MKESTHYILLSILLISLIGASVAFGYVAEPRITNAIHKVQGSYSSTGECRDLDLVDTAYCLREEVGGFYSYNLTNDLEKLDLEDLKTRGGDCKNWAGYYIDQASSLGFNTIRPVVITGDDTAHTFAVMSDSSGYCILDQLNVKCFALEENDN